MGFQPVVSCESISPLDGLKAHRTNQGLGPIRAIFNQSPTAWNCAWRMGEFSRFFRLILRCGAG
jgi:hypothetical protein